MIQPVILCGGSGTRLWPLSRKSLPKQFVPLIGGRSLLQLTLERVKPLGHGQARPETICVGSEDHRFFIRDAAKAAGIIPNTLPSAAAVCIAPSPACGRGQG